MRKQNSIIRILIFVFAALIALLVIGGGIYLFAASRSLKAIALQPDFAETSLEVGTQYTFSISATPSKASVKKATCVVDDPTSSFELNDDGKAVLTTGMNEGNVTVYVECKGIKSQVLTYSIVDSVARAQAEAAAQAEAQKQAEEEAAAQAEAEAAAVAKKYVKATGDNVNVRSTNSTDGDVLGKAKKGEMFEKVEDVDDWTHIMYNGQDGYMKTEFLTEISEEEYNQGPTEETAETKTEEKKEEKKTEEANNNEIRRIPRVRHRPRKRLRLRPRQMLRSRQQKNCRSSRKPLQQQRLQRRQPVIHTVDIHLRMMSGIVCYRYGHTPEMLRK
ncbi:MAG: SH3 domain-containing protein [Lachnospiraceae bacterium]|nr:SH3 domain-containing protein [Lachnospiraceae bacterium]